MWVIPSEEYGFSLIELIVVLLIMSTVMAISAPRLTGRSETAQLQAASQDIQALANAARARAILRNESIALVYMPADNGILLAVADEYVDDPDTASRLSPLRRLAAGLSISIETQQAAAEDFLVFLPDGSAAAGSLSISNKQGQTMKLRVSVPHGRLELPGFQ